MAKKQAGPRPPRRQPQRTCVGCRETSTKRSLVRLVRTPQGGVGIDPTGKAAGRGAYLHDRRSCWQRALEVGALERALRMSLVEADRAALLAHSQQYTDDGD